MSKAFEGTVNVDIRDSTPDWSPFEAPKAPDGHAECHLHRARRRRVLGVELLRRAGRQPESRSHRGRRPSLQAVAHDRLVLADHGRACSPAGTTRATAWRASPRRRSGSRQPSGTIPPENGMLPEILGELGWNTYMVGKWHLCPEDEMNLASTAPATGQPGAGFERFYGFLGAETSRSSRTWCTTTTPSTSRSLPRRDITSPRTSPTRRSSSSATPRRSLRRSRSSSTTRRAPVTRPATRRRSGSTGTAGSSTWATRRCACSRFARQKGLGIVPDDTRAAARQPDRHRRTRTGPDGKPSPLDETLRWESLSDDEKRLLADGRGLTWGSSRTSITTSVDSSTTSKPPSNANTIVIVVSDNGASGEGGPNGSVNQMKFANGIPDDMASNLVVIDELGSLRPTTTTPTVGRWRSTRRTKCGSATSSTVKRATVHRVVAGRHQSRGRARRSYDHAIDLVPTVLDALGVELPETIKGDVQSRFDGVSMRKSFDDAKAPTPASHSSTRCSARDGNGTTAGKPSPPTRR